MHTQRERRSPQLHPLAAALLGSLGVTVTHQAMAPDQPQSAGAVAANAARAARAPRWHELHRVPLPDVDPRTVTLAFAPGEKVVAVALPHDTLLLELDGGRVRHVDCTGAVAPATQNGELLVVGETTATLVDSASGRIQRSFGVQRPAPAVRDAVRAVAAAADGSLLACGGSDAGFWLQPLGEDGKAVRVVQPWDARRLAWSDDGAWLGSIGNLSGLRVPAPSVCKVRVFRRIGAAAEPTAQPDLPRTPATDFDYAEAITFSPGAEHLIVGGRHVVTQYALPSLTLTHQHPLSVHAYWFLDRELAASYDHVRLTLWRAAELQPLGTIDVVPTGDAVPPEIGSDSIDPSDLPLVAAAAAPRTRRIAVVARVPARAMTTANPARFALIVGELR